MKKRLGFDLILMGDPTSGKDTQAKILMKRYSLKPVESGKHWRAMARKNNTEGRWLNRTMSLGYPTPLPLMKKFLKSNTANASPDKDFIFIGTPKLKPEAQWLVKLLKKKHRDFFVIYLRIPIVEILKRTALRHRLKSEDLGVWNRIKYHQHQGSKAVKYFAGMSRLRFINGHQSIKQVARAVQEVINDYQRSRTLSRRFAPLSPKGRELN